MSDAVLLTGTVGAGKTTTLHAVGDLLSARGVAHALVDSDAIRMLRPPPAGDPFQQEIELRNLRDLSRNFRAAGAEILVLATVVERADDLTRYADALAALDLLVVRLTVDPLVVDARLRERHPDDADGLAWHRARAPELAAIIDAAGLDGLTLDTTALTPADAAALIVDRAHGGTRP